MKRFPKKLWRALLGLTLALLLLPIQAFTALAVEEPQAVTYHHLTVDPNGGVFADGSGEAKTFQLRSTGYLAASDYENAGFDRQYAGLSRDGYLPLGFGTSASGAVTVPLYDLANTRFTKDTTLFVIWGRTIQLTIDANGGMLFANTPGGYVALDNPYTTTVPAGDVIPVDYLAQMAVREGWAFGGLTADAAGSHAVPTAERNGTVYYVAPDEDGTYYVQWVVPGTPVIIRQPQNVTVPLGETAVFTVYATGEGLSYQWQYYTGSKWLNSGMTGCETASLRVPVTAARDGRQYRCVITGKNGTERTSSAAKLIADQPLSILTQPETFSGVVGDTAKFSVMAEGAGLKYQWQYNAGSKWTNSGMTGNKTAALSVPVTAARNGQQYRCVITDTSGKTVTSEAVKLLVKTVITAQPKVMLAPIGNTTKFTVTASGAGLTYQWQYYTGSKWTNSSMTGNKTAALSLPVTAARNGQLYRCVITDANGETVISDTGKLKVKTVITVQPQDVTTSAGKTAQFTVTATGAGLTYQWQYYTGSKWTSSGQTGNKTATLSIPATTARNGQQYRCVITDANGKKIYTDPAVLTVG